MTNDLPTRVIEIPSAPHLELNRLPQGNFLMGSEIDEEDSRENEKPQHLVRLASFYIGRYVVTQAQWKGVMGKLTRIDHTFLGDQFPVVNVWLEDALEFCARISKMAGKIVRLPTEAEWEYACRAGTSTAFSYGSSISKTQANFCDTYSAQANDVFLSEIGSFPPNDFGLYDMHGNVWEWCADVWHENYDGAPSDGSAWVNGGDQSYCVQRGGSWRERASNCRSAFRVGDVAHNNDNIVGLRIAMSD